MGAQFSAEQLFKSNDLIARMEAAEVEFIGKGRFGKVFKCAERSKLGKQRKLFAVKVIAMELKINAADIKCDCRKLCHYSYVDSHDRLVETFAYKIVNHAVYLGMEFCEGGSLAGLMLIHRLDECTTQRFTRQILQGLFHLHEHNITHGDLHPGNVLLDAQGNIKLSDFGLHACLPNADGLPLGMPGYVAPELRQRKRMTPLCDVWSLGAIVVMMAVGKATSSNHDGAECLYNAAPKLRRFVSHCFLPAEIRPAPHWLLRYSFLCGCEEPSEPELTWTAKIEAATLVKSV